MIEIRVEAVSPNMNLSLGMKETDPVLNDTACKSSFLALEKVVLNQYATATALAPKATAEDRISEEKKETNSPLRPPTLWNLNLSVGNDQLETDLDLKHNPYPEPLHPPSEDHQSIKPPVLRRIKSDPTLGNDHRRMIFGPFWQARGSNNNTSSTAASPSSTHSSGHRVSLLSSCPPPVQGRKRAASVSGPLPTQRSCEPYWSDVLENEFAAPWDGSSQLLQNHEFFRPVEQLSPEAADFLPDLPRPLCRFYKNGARACLGGVYPLNVDSKSILKSPSYSKDWRSVSSAFNSSSNVPPPPPPPQPASLNFTQSVRLEHHAIPFVRKSDSTDSISSSSSSFPASSSSSRRRITFDPRITITEFDDKCKRLWFDEKDLNRFRLDTIVAAQKYFLSHPEMIAVYNQPSLDPLTGAMRKKALYSLPVLTAELDEDEIDESDGNPAYLTKRSNKFSESLGKGLFSASPGFTVQDISNEHVKRILIVDRNALILDLMKRSTQNIFTKAQITLAKSSDEALRHFQSSLLNFGQGFDIVIVEQRLHQPLATSNTPLVRSAAGAKSYNDFQSMGGHPSSRAAPPRVPSASSRLGFIRQKRSKSPQRSLVRSDSLNGIQKNGSGKKNLSGAELIAKMKAMENAAFAKAASQSVKTSNNSKKITENLSDLFESPFSPSLRSRRALFIGLSVHPEQDQAVFLKHGADFVWGKPPPKMDFVLRDQLTVTLLRKRRQLEEEAIQLEASRSQLYSEEDDEDDADDESGDY